jgi:hypothetical protein
MVKFRDQMQVMCRPAYLDDYSSEYYGSTQRRPYHDRRDYETWKKGTWRQACIYARPWSLSPSDRCRTTSIECVRGSVKKSLLARLVPLSSDDGKNVRELSYLLPAPRLAMQAEADVRSAASSAPLRSFKRRSGQAAKERVLATKTVIV